MKLVNFVRSTWHCLSINIYSEWLKFCLDKLR